MRNLDDVALGALPQIVSKLDAAANVAASVSIAADAAQFWGIDSIGWSYSAAPTGGKLTVAIAGTTVYEIDITAGGHGFIRFPRPLVDTTKNQAVVVTLAAAGAGVIGKLNVQYR